MVVTPLHPYNNGNNEVNEYHGKENGKFKSKPRFSILMFCLYVTYLVSL